jgi:hypothetical protein
MDDKKEFVVVKDGQRQSGLLTNEDAQRKAQAVAATDQREGGS